MTQRDAFYRALMEQIVATDPPEIEPRQDLDRFATMATGATRAPRAWLRSWLWRRWIRPAMVNAAAGGRRCTPLLERLAWLYENLGDAHSRSLLVNLLAFRSLGHERVALPLNRPEYWQQREHIRRMRTGSEEIALQFQGWRLHEFDLAPLGYPIRLMQRVTGIQQIFALEQYRYQRSVKIEAAAGDTVLDGGACWGDSALYFAQRATANGQVFAFEFIPDNLRILRRNLRANPTLSSSIEVVTHPLWSTSDVAMYYDDQGPASRVGLEPFDGSAGSVRSRSIDDFVKERALRTVHFIKMDIEGAELEALRGAEKTLARFRPKLGISVYHKPEHIVEIPEFLSRLGLGYEFYLDHFTTHAEETVLFARAI